MARRTTSFRLWMSGNERQQLMNVAKFLRRSESDAVSWLVAAAAERYSVTSGTIEYDTQGIPSQLREAVQQ
jgi:hypothetical protein